jgi:glycosyltransferase involved in cell wall biosynthesis
LFTSSIIPTIGRNTLSRAVQSILEQEVPINTHEIIIVNDGGQPLHPADWQHSANVRIVETNQRERSVARNTGAALSRGSYLHFLDEDDWLLPDALRSLRALAESSEAAWVYGTAQLFDRQGKLLTQLHPTLHGNCFTQVMAGEWIPPGASLISTELFFKVGGYQHDIHFSEDVDLSRRIALKGEFEGISDQVACFEMGPGGTTDYENIDKCYLWGREQILNMPNVFKRLQDSASSSYWYGRIVRLYLTSILWNLEHKKTSVAASRAFYSLLSLVRSPQHVVKRNFWSAILKHYQSPSFQFGSPVSREAHIQNP